WLARQFVLPGRPARGCDDRAATQPRQPPRATASIHLRRRARLAWPSGCCPRAALIALPVVAHPGRPGPVGSASAPAVPSGRAPRRRKRAATTRAVLRAEYDSGGLWLLAFAGY